MASRVTTVFGRPSSWVIVGAFVVAFASIAIVTTLVERANSSREAEVAVGRVVTDFNALQSIPYDALGGSDAAASLARTRMTATERRIESTLRGLRHTAPSPHLSAAEVPYSKNKAVLEQIRRLVVADQEAQEDVLGTVAGRLHHAVVRDLDGARAQYEKRAAQSLTIAKFGSAAMILLLVTLFAVFYVRSRRAHATAELLAQDNAALLRASREEAVTDPLTGLSNRRALSQDLDAMLSDRGAAGPSVLALFDLDGFKAYNDSFGHPAGDDLLARLAGQFATSLQGHGTVYRIGGDEFCALADAGSDGGQTIAALAAAALSEESHGFSVGCSYGVVVLPTEAGTAEEALRVADQKMYARKASGRTSASRQSTDVLVSVLAERDRELQEHICGVTRLAELTARSLGLPDDDVAQIRLGAELHDIGKAAIPDAILNKPSALDDAEWAFMRRHTIIGERIIGAAPSLAHVATLVRSSHERIDGGGYPDALAGDAIPLGSRIIAVCDAYEAMVSTRVYREPMHPRRALAELCRCSGTQFDPDVVAAFVASVERRATPTVPEMARGSSEP